MEIAELSELFFFVCFVSFFYGCAFALTLSFQIATGYFEGTSVKKYNFMETYINEAIVYTISWYLILNKW